MKYLFISLLFLSSQLEKSGEIIINVTGCTSKKGQVVISLVSNEENYLSEKKHFRYAFVKINDAEKIRFTFKSIPYGNYGIQLFYDENSNKKLDTNFGIPKEKYGFSNNARGRFSKPKYSDIQFEVKSGITIQNIIVK